MLCYLQFVGVEHVCIDFTHPDSSDQLRRSHVMQWLLQVGSSCNGTLLLLHWAVVPVGVAAAYPHSYSNLDVASGTL